METSLKAIREPGVLRKSLADLRNPRVAALRRYERLFPDAVGWLQFPPLRRSVSCPRLALRRDHYGSCSAVYTR